MLPKKEKRCILRWKGKNMMTRSVSRSTLLISILMVAGFGCGSNEADKVQEGQGCEAPFAELGDITIYFEVHGSGDPILMLHGGFSNSEIWEYQIPVLAEKYQVIAMDSRGHGRSTDAEGPITYELLTSDAVALLDCLGIKRAHVVGWSDGGVAGLHMGIRYPEHLNKLVTIGATAQGPGSLYDLFDVMFINQPLFDFMMDLLFRSDYERLNPDPEHWLAFRDKIFELWGGECYFSPIEGEDCMTPLEEIASEVLVMAGQLEMIRKEHTEALHQHIPKSELLFIPWGTHMVMQERPEDVNAVLLDFFR